MPVGNIEPQLYFSSGVFDPSMVRATYDSMRSGSSVFSGVLNDIPDNVRPGLGGGSINGIVLTDEWSRIGSGASPQVTGAAAVVDGNLVVWLIPDMTSTVGGRESK